ncbi:MAG TPA: hypothetical protein VJ718_03360, partial [Candidatus Binataceae bacterium]|nr:hypothetical protein [Candidatus Binataceae bacterium]
NACGAALAAERVRVGRDVLLGGLKASGAICLEGATIGGRLDSEDSVHDGLVIDGVEIGVAGG